MTNFSDKTKQILFFISLILVAGASAWYLAVCTSFAPWGFSDSTTYFTSARNLANGTGLGTLNADGSFSPLQVFAPLFSIVLSLFAKFGADLIVTSRILDILFFCDTCDQQWLDFLPYQ